MLVILALDKLRLGDCKFEASLRYSVKPCLKAKPWARRVSPVVGCLPSMQEAWESTLRTSFIGFTVTPTLTEEAEARR